MRGATDDGEAISLRADFTAGTFGEKAGVTLSASGFLIASALAKSVLLITILSIVTLGSGCAKFGWK